MAQRRDLAMLSQIVAKVQVSVESSTNPHSDGTGAHSHTVTFGWEPATLVRKYLGLTLLSFLRSTAVALPRGCRYAASLALVTRPPHPLPPFALSPTAQSPRRLLCRRPLRLRPDRTWEDFANRPFGTSGLREESPAFCIGRHCRACCTAATHTTYSRLPVHQVQSQCGSAP